MRKPNRSSRLLGLETEYGFAVLQASGSDAGARNDGLARLLGAAQRELRTLPATAGTGFFLANGSRLYVDRGGHPELCTPEADDPAEVVRYVLAGELLLQQLAGGLFPDQAGLHPSLFKCNVDPLRPGVTWGCHENYGHRASPDRLPRQLIPHLVSRILFTGAGGLDLSPGVRFVLSPRACCLTGTTSVDSVYQRGIYHTKQEPLAADGWHRLHLLCGESLCSHLAAWLKLGTTALVVALVELGVNPGDRYLLRNPLQALRTFNHDPSGQAWAALENHGRATALDIQWHYLKCAEDHVSHRQFPPWAEQVCRAWRQTLTRLSQSPHELDTRLDWTIKKALYWQHIRNRGFALEEVDQLNRALDELLGSGKPARPRPLPDPMCPDGEGRLNLFLQQLPSAALSDRMREFLALRAELGELEVRFGQVVPEGLFSILDGQGLLHHRLPGLSTERIRQAVRHPPDRGRAHVRGKLISQLAGTGSYLCDWTGIWDEKGRMLDLSDPLTERAPAWKSPAQTAAPGAGGLVNFLVEEVDLDYAQGRYEAAWAKLVTLAAFSHQLQPARLFRSQQLRAYVQFRRGFWREALELMDGLVARHGLSFSIIVDYAGLFRYQGLAPAPAIWDWINKGEQWLASHTRHDLAAVFTFKAHKARAFIAADRLAEAQGIYEEILPQVSQWQPTPRQVARALSDCGDLHRRMDRRAEAARDLDEAEKIQRQHRLLGDLADHTLLQRVKLEGSLDRAGRWLLEAEAIQRRLRNRIGQVRSALLKARLCSMPRVASLLRRRVDQWRGAVPALRECPLLEKILSSWEQWCAGETLPECQDHFWGL